MTPAAFAIPGDMTTLTGGYIYERRLLEGLRAAGRDVTHLALPSGFPDPSGAETEAAAAMLQAVGPDRVLILDGFVSGAMETARLARVRAPMVAIVHHPLALEEGLSEARRAHLYRTERDNLALVRHVIVPSPHTARTLVDRYGVPGDRITVARPGVDPASGPPDPVDPPLILSVGILHPRKGHDVLIAALEHIRALPWTCVIVGRDWDTDHARALARQAAQTGLGARLRLAGEVELPQLQRLYRQATLFALATRYEGYGIVFAEALRHGLPVISCRVGAVPDTVPHGTGRLVPPDDPRAFAAALQELLATPAALRDCRLAARLAGDGLPGWPETARLAGDVLETVARDG
ncbi:glycosyltransferase family 4 protein [Marinibacterium profundimaris]|uniref:Glycosyl transferase family 1 n=1 Tax=Marinibacterium profundimaris TaxID=1679460 RepID=A0A225NBJ0_9RHOB|nr:glycosyltransferase family 4 protein [Marinibacterium profundimaris]MAU96147.1 glycosyltransferase family 1 protein [Fulvimarina sp.]OWU68059.1 glycosyl transferase family 1 [Marinibacterium profundimaris]